MASPPQAGSPATARKPQHHPKHKRDRVNRQGKPGTLARQSPSMRQSPPAHAGTPARQSPQRAPEPQRAPGRKPGGFAARHVLASRAPSAPGRKPGSGASTEPSIGLRIVNLAKHQIPRALATPSSEFPRRRIVSYVRLWSKLTILRSLMAKTLDYLRYRKAHTRTTGKNVHFSLPKPRKTVCFDRQRPKPTVFRIAHPQSEGAAPERGRDSRGRRGARAKVVAPGARAVAPRARARRRARRAYANDTEPSAAPPRVGTVNRS